MIPKFDIRWATDNDAEQLAVLWSVAGLTFDDFELDWTHMGMTWLMAFDENAEALAAIQVFAGYPVARLEMLLVNPEMGFKQRVVVIRDLTDHAAAILRAAKCQLVASTIPAPLEGYLKSAEHRGWVPWGDTSVNIVKRLN